MSNSLFSVPWGNLWRWVVSTFLFVLVIGMPIAVVTSVDEGPSAPTFRGILILCSAVVAAIVVWSEDIRWIGDT